MEFGGDAEAIVKKIEIVKKDCRKELIKEYSPSKAQLNILFSLAFQGPTVSQSELFKKRKVTIGDVTKTSWRKNSCAGSLEGTRS